MLFQELYLSRLRRAATSLGSWKLVPIRQGGSEEGDLAPFSLARFLLAPASEEERVFGPLAVPVFYDAFHPAKRRLRLVWFGLPPS